MIVCPVIELIKTEYKQTLRIALMKVKECTHLVEAINLLLNDINNYLNGRDPYDGITMQSLIGMQSLFRGWITKN